jgi:hypothetical protein
LGVQSLTASGLGDLCPFDLQAIYRRITKTWYVPIYFLIFPSGRSDRLYAEYFSEDDMYGVGSEMSAKEKLLKLHGGARNTNARLRQALEGYHSVPPIELISLMVDSPILALF